MSSKIYFMTESFPFGVGEAFIETGIKELAKLSDNVAHGPLFTDETFRGVFPKCLTRMWNQQNK